MPSKIYTNGNIQCLSLQNAPKIFPWLKMPFFTISNNLWAEIEVAQKITKLCILCKNLSKLTTSKYIGYSIGITMFSFSSYLGKQETALGYFWIIWGY